MLAPVDLDGELRLGAEKVQHMAADGLLPPELRAGDVPPPQHPPEGLFGLGLRATEFAGARDETAIPFHHVNPLTPTISLRERETFRGEGGTDYRLGLTCE